MKIWEKIIETYSDLTANDDFQALGIWLKDDGDGIDYIDKWEYSKPIPEGLTLGKPQA